MAIIYYQMQHVIIAQNFVLNAPIVKHVKNVYPLIFMSMVHALKEYPVVYITWVVTKIRHVWFVCLDFLFLGEVARLAFNQDAYYVVNNLYVLRHACLEMCHSILLAYLASKASINTI